MSGKGYKALGFVVWKGGMWYLRRRYALARRAGTGLLAAGAVAAVGGVVLAARRKRASG